MCRTAVASSVEAIGGKHQVASTRKLRRELTYEVTKLRGLQQTLDPTLDEVSAKALAIQIRKQAGICSNVLDRYQSSVPARMWSYAERKCQPLREDLKRTEMLYRAASGEWEGHAFVARSRPWWSPTDTGKPKRQAMDHHGGSDT
jgi:hypothetical protein